MTLTPRRAALLALGMLAALVAFLFALRGQDAGASPTATAAKTHVVHVSASKSAIAFNKTRLTVKHGKVSLVMTNPSGLSHGVAIEGHGVDKDGKIVGKGGTSRVTVTLKKGTYEFYCPVPGHKAAGMKGKLVVK